MAVAVALGVIVYVGVALASEGAKSSSGSSLRSRRVFGLALCLGILAEFGVDGTEERSSVSSLGSRWSGSVGWVIAGAAGAFGMGTTGVVFAESRRVTPFGRFIDGLIPAFCFPLLLVLLEEPG